MENQIYKQRATYKTNPKKKEKLTELPLFISFKIINKGKKKC